MRMIDQKTGGVNVDEIEDLQLRSLYNIAGLQFVVPDGIVKGEYEIVKSEEEETNQNALILKVSSGDESKVIELFGEKVLQIILKELEFLV